MTKLISPAPWGIPGLEFGNTSQAPYRPGYPHQGQDHQWRRADVDRSRRTVAGASGTVITAYNDGGYHLGWGNYVDILIPATGHRIVLRLAHHATGTVVAPRGGQITAGAPVGVMGATGKVAGIHLHEGLMIDGRWVDPIYYRTHDLPGTGSTASASNSTPINPAQPEEEDELMGAREDILAAVDQNTARLRLEIRGHIFYDAGEDGKVPFADTKHAALINAAGRIIVMASPPVGQEASWRRDTYKYTEATRTAEQNRVPLTSGEFWNKIKDELTARGNDFYTVETARAWFENRQKQIAG